MAAANSRTGPEHPHPSVGVGRHQTGHDDGVDGVDDVKNPTLPGPFEQLDRDPPVERSQQLDQPLGVVGQGFVRVLKDAAQACLPTRHDDTGRPVEYRQALGLDAGQTVVSG